MPRACTSVSWLQDSLMMGYYEDFCQRREQGGLLGGRGPYAQPWILLFPPGALGCALRLPPPDGEGWSLGILHLLPWALTSSTTGQGVFTITSLGLERRPVLSTPHRVNLAGRMSLSENGQTLPGSGGVGGVAPSCSATPRCTYCHH